MIRRLLVVLPLAALLVGATATGVAAAKPPPPPPLFSFAVPCPEFTAQVSVTRDNETTTATQLANGNIVVFVSGVELATVANETTGQSMNVNTSAATTLTIFPDGSATATSDGPALVSGLPPLTTSEFIPPLGLYDGILTFTYSSPESITGFSYVGRVVDLCAALSS